MDGPKTRRQSAELNAFDAALFDEGDWILKVVVRVLCTIGREDSTWRHWLAIDCFDYSQFVSADLDQRHFAHDALERILDEVQARLEHVCLNTHLAFSRHDASRRHLGAEIAPFFDRNFTRADIDKDTPQN